MGTFDARKPVEFEVGQRVTFRDVNLLDRTGVVVCAGDPWITVRWSTGVDVKEWFHNLRIVA